MKQHSTPRVPSPSAGADGGDLAGRVRVAGVFRPGDPGAVAETMVQAFVWTDIVAAGLLTLGSTSNSNGSSRDRMAAELISGVRAAI